MDEDQRAAAHDEAVRRIIECYLAGKMPSKKTLKAATHINQWRVSVNFTQKIIVIRGYDPSGDEVPALDVIWVDHKWRWCRTYHDIYTLGDSADEVPDIPEPEASNVTLVGYYDQDPTPAEQVRAIRLEEWHVSTLGPVATIQGMATMEAAGTGYITPMPIVWLHVDLTWCLTSEGLFALGKPAPDGPEGS